MAQSATDYLTGIYGPLASGQGNTTVGNIQNIIWVLPYTDSGSGNQSFTNGSGTTTAPTPTYTNPE